MNSPAVSVRRACARCEKSILPPRCRRPAVFHCPFCRQAYRCREGRISPIRSGLTWVDLSVFVLGLLAAVASMILFLLGIVVLGRME